MQVDRHWGTKVSELSAKGRTIAKWTASEEYKDGWERIFGKKKEGDAATGHEEEGGSDSPEENLDGPTK